jgi:hypothetical protein
MSFVNVYNALYDQLKASSYLTYVDQNQFLKGFTENIPSQEYTIVLEPGAEEEPVNLEASGIWGNRKGVIYNIEIHMRVMFVGSSNQLLIIGDTINNKKGVLEFSDDVKAAIGEDWSLGYDRAGSSISAINAGTSFALTSSLKNIAVSINGRTPNGYDTILCGDSTLNGTQVASNIQSALRALGNHADDGYYEASCSFDNSAKQFTISTYGNHPDDSVVVTAGVSNDCSAVLGFDSPTEVNGRNVSDIKFETVIPNNTFFPVRYRVLPVKIWEEIMR